MNTNHSFLSDQLSQEIQQSLNYLSGFNFKVIGQLVEDFIEM